MYNTDEMAKEFLHAYCGNIFTKGQQLVFSFQNKPVLGLVVKRLLCADANALHSGGKVEPKDTNVALLQGNTLLQFEKAEGTGLNLTGKAMG